MPITGGATTVIEDGYYWCWKLGEPVSDLDAIVVWVKKPQVLFFGTSEWSFLTDFQDQNIRLERITPPTGNGREPRL
jgi:hypothetical protein